MRWWRWVYSVLRRRFFAGGSSSRQSPQSDQPEVYSNGVLMEVFSHDGELVTSYEVPISANGHDPERSNDATH